MGLFVDEEKMRESILKEVKASLGKLVQEQIKEKVEKTVVEATAVIVCDVLADVFKGSLKPLEKRIFIYCVDEIKEMAPVVKLKADIGAFLSAEVGKFVQEQATPEISRQTEQCVYGEGFLDKLVARLRKKQLPGGING